VFYYIHSWLRWVVFAVGLVAVLYPLHGLVRRRPYARVMWTIAGLFAATLHIQVLSGFFLIFSGRWGLLGENIGLHMILSIPAAVIAQSVYSMMRRRPREERSYAHHLVGALVAMILVLLGIWMVEPSIIG
jgi:Co/Zn/Cd efflux system component